MTYHVEELSDLQAFESVGDEWNALLARTPRDQPFLRHEWLCNWWRHFGEDRRPAVIAVRRDSRLVFAVPLLEEPRRFLGLAFPCLRSWTNHHSFRSGFLQERGESEAIRRFWDYLARRRTRRWHVLQIDELPREGEDEEGFIAGAAASGLRTRTVPGTHPPYVPLDGGWDDYYASLKTKFRSNMRNRLKRLNKNGETSFEQVREAARLAPALEQLFEIEQRSWKGEAGTAIALDPVLRNYYTGLARIAAQNGWLRITFLKLDDRAIAADLSLEYGGTMYCVKIGFDPEFRPYSPGQVLVSHILAGCFESGLAEYDFLGDTSVQKRDWQPRERDHSFLYVYKPGWVSTLHEQYRFTVRARARSLLKR